MSAAELRVAHDGDVESIVALAEAVAAEGRWIGHEAPLDRAGVTEALQRAIASDDVHDVVAFEAGELVGHLTATERSGRVSLGMYVAQAARGKGIGRALLAAALAWAGERDAHKVHLEVWPHNSAAIALYASAGFVVEGRRLRHYRRRNGELWDSLLMGLVLDTDSPGGPS